MPDITVTTETMEQFDAALKSPDIGTVYADIRFFDAASLKELVIKAHESGRKAGLRLPQIYRDRSRVFYEAALNDIIRAGFDILMFGNMEELIYFNNEGVLRGMLYALDHSIYIYNNASVQMLIKMLNAAGIKKMPESVAYPLELNFKELMDTGLNDINDLKEELTVYGRVPMMVSAQCMGKTVSGCDGRDKLLWLKDRTGARMPVKNSCRFCLNTIYNSVPTAVYDMKDEIMKLAPSLIRYEFTVENAAEVKAVLSGKMPEPGRFTRGHFKKSVM